MKRRRGPSPQSLFPGFVTAWMGAAGHWPLAEKNTFFIVIDSGEFMAKGSLDGVD